jgi:Na+/H+ antiporter NhaD/arsenite permease-like protein
VTTEKILTACVFSLVYVWLIISKKHRAKAIWVGVLVLWAAGALLENPILGLRHLFEYDATGWSSVNWNVIGIFAGTLLIAEAFVYSRVPATLSDLLIDKSPNVCWAALGVCALSSFLSIFVENVATVLIVAPIALEVARRQGFSPVPFVVGIAICSNLQGTATLIGDPPSMILASEYRMTFNDFFWFHGRPGIFFAVQVGAAAGFGVLWLFFRRFRGRPALLPVEKVKGWLPTVMLGVMVVGLALSSLVDEDFMWWGAVLCLGLGFVCILWVLRQNRGAAGGILKAYDTPTTLFLVAVFLMVRALENVGLIDDLARGIGGVTGSSMLGRFLVIVVFSMLVSAFIDNVPYLAVMLGVVHKLTGTAELGEARFLLPFGLLVGACIGGNITPVGASANIVAHGLLRREGKDVGFLEFVKFGLPFTLAATAGAALFLWIVWR